jgi:haloalkane dehalogenase
MSLIATKPSTYPFAPHYLRTEAGHMHYVDVGAGPPVVLLHGNPTWSFLYRRLIRRLAPTHRCIAPDYIGFGRSDKPIDANYKPAAQAARVEALINRLDLHDVTLVVHDWGGPIGLSYALRHPERVRRIVIANSWLWPLHRDAWIAFFSWWAGSALGRMLITRGNAFARVILPLAFADRTRLSDAAFQQYCAPLATPADRVGSWVLPRALLSATPWLSALWADRHRLDGLPMCVVWGLRDPAFSARHLRRWQTAFPRACIHPLPDVGHYVPEEAPRRFNQIVSAFLANTA